MTARLSDWRSGFATAAMTAVGTLWAGNLQRALEEIGTEIKPAVIAEQVQWMLGDEEAGLNRPLYWRSWEELEGSGGVQKSVRSLSSAALMMIDTLFSGPASIRSDSFHVLLASSKYHRAFSF